MEAPDKVNRYLHVSGVVLLIAGALDPVEGSVIIAVASLLLAYASYRKSDLHWKLFLAAFIMIIIGVISLFYLSSYGGFGANSLRSWWWGLLILPYPIGWAMDLIVLVVRDHGKNKTVAHTG